MPIFLTGGLLDIVGKLFFYQGKPFYFFAGPWLKVVASGWVA